MRFLILVMFLPSLLFSYQVGDNIHPEVSQKLNLQPNKIYVVDFFASWCASCKKELPLISKLSQKLDTKSVEVIGVDVDEEIQDGQAFQKELQLSFRVIDDPKGEIVQGFNPIAMPAIYIIKEGKVVELIIGAKDHIDTLIEDKLKAMEL